MARENRRFRRLLLVDGPAAHAPERAAHTKPGRLRRDVHRHPEDLHAVPNHSRLLHRRLRAQLQHSHRESGLCVAALVNAQLSEGGGERFDRS